MRWLGLTLIFALGCGAEAPPGGEGGGAETDGRCGLDQRRDEGGACVPVGVPLGECGEGFDSDARGGCVPVLPDASCPSGTMALPGETACRPVTGCPEGDWSFVEPSEAVLYVDGSAEPGGAGTMASPFVTITEAVTAAGPDQTIAIADGVYVEDISLTKRLSLVGRCPDAVTIQGAGGPLGALVVVTQGASGATIRGLSVTGPGLGIGLASTQQVTLEDLRVHDTGHQGVAVVAQTEPTSAVLRNVLIEGATEIALLAAASGVVVEDTVIRDTNPAGAGLLGVGIFARSGDGNIAIPGPASVEMSHSVVSGNAAAGITLAGSQLVARRLLVRDTLPQALDGQDGFGIFGADQLLQPLVDDPVLDLDQVVVQRSFSGGVVIQGGVLNVRRTTVVDTSPNQVTGAFGTGVTFQFGPAEGSLGSIADSAIERSHGEAVLVARSDVVVERSVMRETLPYSDAATLGDGLLVGAFDETASLVVRGSLVQDNVRAGVASFGGAVTIGQTQLSCNPIDLNGQDLGGTFSFTDEGGNVCGCDGVLGDCQLQRSTLTPPTAP